MGMDIFNAGLFEEDTDTLVDVEELLDTGTKRNLILYNDDYNTFEFVISTLIELCNHTLEQAEQCTLLVHYTGKCAVKLGSAEELKPICTAMLNRGLTAEIH